MDENLEKTVDDILEQIEILGDRQGERVEQIESGRDLEEKRAEEAYEEIRESSANLFEGFGPTSSTPKKESESLTVGKVINIVRSFETLHLSTETEPKEKLEKQIESKKRHHTRTVTKEGDCSPFKTFEPKKRKVLTAKRKTQFANMSNLDIPNAKRLNPRGRKAGGGEDPGSLGFKKLTTTKISSSGKIVIKQFDALRNRIVNDRMLILVMGQDITSVDIQLLTEYIDELKDILTEFQSEPDDIEETNADGQAVIDEIIELKSELASLRTYCKMNIDVEIEKKETIPVQKLKAQNFPTFDGTDDGTTFLIWQDQITKMMLKIRDPEERKNRLLECMLGEAKHFVDSIITTKRKYDDNSRLINSLYCNY